MEKISLYALYVESIVNRIRQNLLDQKFVIMAEVPSTSLMFQEGYEIPFIHQIFFFSPELFNMMVNIDFDSVMNAPLKIVISKDETSDLIEIRYASFQESFFEYTVLAPIFEQADERLKRVFSFKEKF
ncbi:MAG TPA: hypothetical protein VNJ08_01670 [Bacteriovoracaceae bacterium]|nr:hypothetical protein [Bacteriovoracaceae bacterium]